MATNPVDPLQTLQAALNTEPNSKEQADLLATLRESLEAYPTPIRVLVPILISKVVNAADSLLKSWVIDLFHFGLCRSSLSLDIKTQLSSQTLETLSHLLDDPNPATVKVVIQILTTVYPLLFRSLCANRTNPTTWNVLSNCKSRILSFVSLPNVNTGVRISALKFMQRVILVQIPQGVSDPRLQNKNDPNLSFCPANHPFISVTQLEAEGQLLLKTVIEILYSTQNVDLLSALLNSWATLVKTRPNMMNLVVAALKQWTPSAFTGSSASTIKSAEKAVRILLVHISRCELPGASQFVPQINEALAAQTSRMELALSEEKKRKAATVAGITDTKKRPTSEADRTDVKRVKLESAPTEQQPPQPSDPSLSLLASFDFSTLPATLITDLIVANLEAFTEPALLALVQAYRQRIGSSTSTSTAAAPVASTSAAVPGTSQAAPALPSSSKALVEDIARPPTPAPVKEEPVDPLQMDIDQDELEYEPDKLNAVISGPAPSTEQPTDLGTADQPINLTLAEFKLPPPKELASTDERIDLISKSITRIHEEAAEMSPNMVMTSGSDTATIGGPLDMWMLLVVRMFTRVADPPLGLERGDDGEDAAMGGEDEEKNKDVTAFYERQDRLRRILCDYIMSDFPGRIRLATTWMNEEWYNDQIRLEKNPNWRPNYDIWLGQIVASYQTHLDGKDRTFARFLLDLPSLPADVLSLLRELCVDNESPDKMQIGFSTLRGFVMQRPLIRADALNVLLELTTHFDKKIRGAAINTVKLWVPNHQPMDSMIREFALQILRKLQQVPVQPVVPPESNGDSTTKVNGDSSHVSTDEMATDDHKDEAPVVPDAGSEMEEGQEENMEDGQLPSEDLIQTPYLPERIELPAEKSHVLQHVELLFALSVKVPDLLDDLFAAYGQMDITVQEAIQSLITALVRSLGSSHGKLLTLMRTCPPGAESLALRVLTIFTEHGRPSPQLVALVKGLINERDLDARFLIPIIAEMDKPDIVRHLPRIVSILDGKAESKNLVRSVFSSVVTTPPQTFGSVTSNMPRVRQSELLTPAELMVLLHDSEKEIGIKSAKEAIGICFSMTDVFRSEILAVVMQQIMDEPVLPVLFLRTVIQAVTTYKSLVGFVSTTLLSRLITKKIWTNPLLWEGFIHCAKVIAPASFGALLQLPKEQLRELVDKQPSLKAGLRDYVTKKAPNKARVSGFLDIFSETIAVESPVEVASNGEPPRTTQPESGAGSGSA
ncbi:Symplekin tight junction protein C terminal-domain-containing protein [Lentinula raphanica]|nr:Symplekin tight junction protein C terminal-domain-containing protein [Lentinula raphanica]